MPDFPRIDEPVVHGAEGADWGADPDSGAVVRRLTSAPGWSHNIYCEQPYASPDGRRVLIGRTRDLYSGSYELLVADVETLGITLVERDVPSEMVAHRSWGEWAYYPMRDGSLRRLSLLSLERQRVLPPGSVGMPPQTWFETISPDEKWLIGSDRSDDKRPGFVTFALNIETRERRVVRDTPDNRNPHIQAELGGEGRLLFQLLRPEGSPKVPVFVGGFPAAGGAAPEPAMLPIGGKWTAESTGHMAWIGDTGRIACALDWNRADRRQDERHPEGNVAIVGPGDASARIVGARGHALYHVSVSRCARYFVGDDFMSFRTDAFASGARGPGPTRIVVGSIATGRTRVLLADCQNHGIAGSSRFEPDPYFTADNRHVIYNASPWGAMQVFAARLPEGFLASLD